MHILGYFTITDHSFLFSVFFLQFLCFSTMFLTPKAPSNDRLYCPPIFYSFYSFLPFTRFSINFPCITPKHFYFHSYTDVSQPTQAFASSLFCYTFICFWLLLVLHVPLSCIELHSFSAFFSSVDPVWLYLFFLSHTVSRCIHNYYKSCFIFSTVSVA